MLILSLNFKEFYQLTVYWTATLYLFLINLIVTLTVAYL